MNDLLRLYEFEQRRNVHYYGTRTEQTPEVVRVVDIVAGQGAIIYSQLNEANADRVIREQVDYFNAIGQDFEWKVFSYDTPADLRERLMAAGFECDEPEAIMVLDLENAPASLFEPVSADIRQISEPAQIAQLVQILDQVWNDEHEIIGKLLTEELASDEFGKHLAIYLAYVDDLPVSTAWIRFYEGSQFAGLWGGATLSGYRQRGLYTGLLSVRAQEARRRGVHYLTIDASPMSQPIAAKHGFQTLALAYACNWTSNPSA